MKDKDRDRLPPGQYLRTDFPVLHYGDIPKIEIDKWEFVIDGLVRNNLRFKFEELLGLFSIEVKTDFHCVTGWSRLTLL